MTSEGAASLGASPLRRFVEVIASNATSGIFVGAFDGRDAVARGIQPHLHAAQYAHHTLPIGLADADRPMGFDVETISRSGAAHKPRAIVTANHAVVGTSGTVRRAVAPDAIRLLPDAL